MNNGTCRWIALWYLAGVIFVASCQQQQKLEDAIIGRWQKAGENGSIEFFKDGRVVLTLENGTVVPLKYSLIGSNSLKITGDEAGYHALFPNGKAQNPSVELIYTDIAIKGDRLTMIDSKTNKPVDSTRAKSSPSQIAQASPAAAKEKSTPAQNFDVSGVWMTPDGYSWTFFSSGTFEFRGDKGHWSKSGDQIVAFANKGGSGWKMKFSADGQKLSGTWGDSSGNKGEINLTRAEASAEEATKETRSQFSQKAVDDLKKNQSGAPQWQTDFDKATASARIGEIPMVILFNGGKDVSAIKNDLQLLNFWDKASFLILDSAATTKSPAQLSAGEKDAALYEKDFAVKEPYPEVVLVQVGEKKPNGEMGFNVKDGKLVSSDTGSFSYRVIARSTGDLTPDSFRAKLSSWLGSSGSKSALNESKTVPNLSDRRTTPSSNAPITDSTQKFPDSGRYSGVIDHVTMAQDTYGPQKKPANPTTTFRADSVFHAVVTSVNAPPNTRFSATWYAVNIGNAAPPNSRIDSDELVAEGSRNLDFALKPKSQWPTGTYRVDIAVNGSVERSTNFGVQ
jgi:hypothetical protein